MHQVSLCPVEQIAQPPHVGHPRARIGPRGLQQDMIGLVLAQHVVDQIGREGDLLAGLALAGMLPLDQPADHRDLPEGPAQQVRILHPVHEFVREYIGR